MPWFFFIFFINSLLGSCEGKSVKSKKVLVFLGKLRFSLFLLAQFFGSRSEAGECGCVPEYSKPDKHPFHERKFPDIANANDNEDILKSENCHEDDKSIGSSEKPSIVSFRREGLCLGAHVACHEDSRNGKKNKEHVGKTCEKEPADEKDVGVSVADMIEEVTSLRGFVGEPGNFPVQGVEKGTDEDREACNQKKDFVDFITQVIKHHGKHGKEER